MPDRAAGGGEDTEDLPDLLIRMLGTERAAQQIGAGRRGRRAGEVHVQTAFQQRLPQGYRRFLIRQHHRDDRGLRRFRRNVEAQFAQARMEAAAVATTDGGSDAVNT